jgi:hypothetical protein
VLRSLVVQHDIPDARQAQLPPNAIVADVLTYAQQNPKGGSILLV